MNQFAALYKDIQQTTDTGRSLEAQILLKASFKLQQIQNNWGAKVNSELIDALQYNQKLWSILQGEMLQDSNPLPQEIKANILSLSIFVDKRTFEIIANPDTDAAKLNILIKINKELATSLTTQ